MTRQKTIVFYGIDDWYGISRCLIFIRKMHCLCMKLSSQKYIAISLLIILSVLIGTLIVCLTSIKPKHICEHKHRPTVTHIDKYRSHPQSVAIDQFNNDTLFDFVVANTGLHTIDIYLGLTNGTFQHQITYSTGTQSQPCSVATGNLDNHHGIDIATANYGTNTILIFSGLNNGSFLLNQSFSMGSSRPLMIALTDLNNDHRLDIIVLNYGTNCVGIFIGLFDGSFTLSMNYSTGYDSLPKSFVIADLNNDTYLDIIVANSGTNTIGLFYGNGNGTFIDQKAYSTGIGSNPLSVTVGDINHDDILDVIVANYNTSNIEIFFGNQDGNYTKRHTYSTSLNSHPTFIAVHDVNGDNHLDMIVIDSINDRVYILPGNENGTFPLLSIYIADSGSNPVSIACIDLNNDNRLDILIVNRDANNILTLIEYNIELSGSYTKLNTEKRHQIGSIAIGDLNGDGILNMVVVDDNVGNISIFLGYGNGSFTPFGVVFSNFNGIVHSVKLGDFNNDHQLDIAVLNSESDRLCIFLGYGYGNFSTVTTYSTRIVLDPSSYVTGDVNNDNCLDIIVISHMSTNMGVFVGDCNGAFEMIAIYQVETGWKPRHILIDDFNNDNYADFTITYSNYNGVSLYFGDGNGEFSMFQAYTTKDAVIWGALASGDFNNDNHTDLAVVADQTNKIVILFGSENGTFVNETTYSIESCYYMHTIIAGNFNSDSQLDLVISCPLKSKIMILFGNNNGEFLSHASHSTGEKSYPSFLASGDFNHDNKLDIVISDQSGRQIGIWLVYYKADFAIQSKYSTGSSPQPYSVAIGDFNNDNISDLVIANSGNKNINIRLGFGNGSFRIGTVYSTGQNSFPQHINTADLNRDGQVDIVIVDSEDGIITILLGNGDGTFGSSFTYSMGFQSNPTSVSIANMNSDKWLDLVVTNYGTDNVGIFYGHDYATFNLHRTYSTGNKSYPRAVSIADMNNDKKLDIVVANHYSNNIGIFFGDGNGSFAAQITYSTGNNSHPRSMTVADMNKDGWLDVIIGNDGTDSIAIIFGNGNGTFETMISYPIGQGSIPSFVVIADVNNDNEWDVIIADEGKNNVGIFLGLGNGSLSVIIIHSTDTDSRPSSIALGDFNHDGYLDMAVALPDLDSIDISQGFGNGSFIHQITDWFQRGAQPNSVVFSDFNNDDELDIAVTITGFGSVLILYGFGNGSFIYTDQAVFLTRTFLHPIYLIVNDFNNDNRSDIAVLNFGSNGFNVLFATENDDLVQGRHYATSSGSPSKVMASGDLNNDSHPDFVVVNIEDDNIDIFLRNGKEIFGAPFIKPTGFGSQPYFVVTGDFDNSNRSDIVVANYGTDSIGVILGYLIEYPYDPTIYSTGIGSRPCAIAAADFNGDNQLDIAVVNSGTNNIIIFQGFGNGSFQIIGSYSTGIGSIPSSIVVVDFDNNHRLDLAIANTGANNILVLFSFGNGTFGNETLYSMGYNSRPHSIAVGDFDRDGWMDMAVANFEADYVEILLQPC